MRKMQIFNPWVVRYIRALCFYGFSFCFFVLVGGYITEEFRPGFFSLVLQMQDVLVLTVILGLAVVTLPRSEVEGRRVLQKKSQHGLSLFGAFIIGLIAARQVEQFRSLQILIFVVVAISVYFILFTLLSEEKFESEIL